MRRVPFASILADYRDRKLKEELASDWGSLVFYRMPSFVLAWALIPTGVTPLLSALAIWLRLGIIESRRGRGMSQ